MKRFLKPLSYFFLTFLLISGSQVSADETTRIPYRLDESYSGPHQASFQKLRYTIPNLVRQTTIDMAVRLGMQFEEGWRYPLEIGFVDDSPEGMENVLAYVQLGQTEDGRFAQRLNINLEAFEKESFNLEKVFAHELVHAMMNDAIGGEAAVSLPTWFQEGLAVFGADQGENMVRTYAHEYFGMGDNMLINGLEGPHSALDYAEDYLAMKYLNEKVGSNAFHNFVREVIARKGDIQSALKYSCFMDWDEFQQKVKNYSKEEIKNLGPSRRGESRRPY